jgi:serine/threonine protein kinase/Flp pilus assembly protein TadD
MPHRPEQRSISADIPGHQLLREIGRGSYGAVWLARNDFGTLRAVKFVHRSDFEDERPFQREIQGIKAYEPISRLHDGLVDILQLGVEEDSFYYVMELADDANAVGDDVGDDRAPESYCPRTLHSELKRRRRFPASECIRFGLQMADALDFLHARGLVHRDIKPSNVIFVQGQPKLADVGSVAAIEDARSMVGTLGYVPISGAGTPQGDIYAFGKVLYEMCTGCDRRDFPTLPEDLKELQDRRAVVELNEILIRACADNPKERYRNISELRHDLKLLSEGRSIRAVKSTKRMIRGLMTVGVIAAAALGAMKGLQSLKEARLPEKRQEAATNPMIAVLPFELRTGASSDLGENIAEEIAQKLTRLPSLRVLATSTAGWLKRQSNQIDRAKSMNVGVLIDGSVVEKENELKIRVQAIDAKSEFQIWADAYTGTPRDLAGMLTKIAADISAALKVQITEALSARLAGAPPASFEAYQAYLHGRNLLNKTSRAGLKEAIVQFTRCIEIAPGFALAHSSLADAYTLLSEKGDSPPIEYWPLAEEAAKRAFSLDPMLPEAHIALAQVYQLYHYDWAKAEASYKHGLELNPNNAKGHLWYALFLINQDRPQEAWEHRRLASELDPYYPSTIGNLGHQARDKGDFETALKFYLQSLTLSPDKAEVHRFIAENYIYWGKPELAVDAYEEYFRRQGEPEEHLRDLRASFARAGWDGYWRTRVIYIESTPHKYRNAWVTAIFYAHLGEKEKVLELLEKSIKWREFYAPQMKSFPAFKPFRDDPRFVELLHSMGLEPLRPSAQARSP